jgi:hypothetical protein
MRNVGNKSLPAAELDLETVQCGVETANEGQQLTRRFVLIEPSAGILWFKRSGLIGNRR